MAICKLEGEIVISSSTTVGTFGAFTITMPVGRYFLNSIGSGGATRSFCDELEFQMESSMGAGSSTVTVDDNSDSSLGNVTISRSSAFTITWSSTTIRDLLGFEGDRGSSATQISTSQAKYLYLPNCGRSGVMSPQSSNGAIEADYTLSMGTDGTPYALSYSKRYKDSLEFRTLKGSRTWISQEQEVLYQSLEQFYSDVISLGLRVRFHADRSVDATFRTWVVEDGGSFEPRPVREDWTDGSESLWAIRWIVRKTT
jgi:hypothetical protein